MSDKSYLINGIPSDLLTGSKIGTRRLATDSSPAAFSENREFKFYDDRTGAENVADTEILIYRFTTTYPLILQLRLINGVAGSRKYTVYPDNGGETIVGGSWLDVTATKLSPINNDLSKSGLSVHPTSGVTVEERIATSFTTTAPKRTGTIYKADGNANRSTESYNAGSNASGVAAGQSFLLVLEDLYTTDDSEFLFQLEWQEDF